MRTLGETTSAMGDGDALVAGTPRRRPYLLGFGGRGKVEAIELLGAVDPLAERVGGLLEDELGRDHAVDTDLAVLHADRARKVGVGVVEERHVDHGRRCRRPVGGRAVQHVHLRLHRQDILLGPVCSRPPPLGGVPLALGAFRVWPPAPCAHEEGVGRTTWLRAC